MKITDKNVLQMQKKLGSSYLDDIIADYPDDERYGRTDLEFFAEEVSYFVYCHHEDGHDWKDELAEYREIIRRTRGGFMPINPYTFKPLYSQSDIMIAKEFVSEYTRARNCLKKLQAQGVYGSWYIV
ncbi:MAG: hypothetical protein IKU26_08860 [Clostridia bacterium]|nr:hypothetical protein [Clostridia bacterium]